MNLDEFRRRHRELTRVTPCDLDHAVAVTAARHIFGDDFADQLAGGYAVTHIEGVVDGFYALFDVQRIWDGGEVE